MRRMLDESDRSDHREMQLDPSDNVDETFDFDSFLRVKVQYRQTKFKSSASKLKETLRKSSVIL